jgi:hypothetical protein
VASLSEPAVVGEELQIGGTYGAGNHHLLDDDDTRHKRMRSASLPMYPFPEATAATAAFWDALRVRLVAGGLDIRDVVFEGARASMPEGIGPNVLFSQICGFHCSKFFAIKARFLRHLPLSLLDVKAHTIAPSLWYGRQIQPSGSRTCAGASSAATADCPIRA